MIKKQKRYMIMMMAIAITISCFGIGLAGVSAQIGISSQSSHLTDPLSCPISGISYKFPEGWWNVHHIPLNDPNTTHFTGYFYDEQYQHQYSSEFYYNTQMHEGGGFLVNGWKVYAIHSLNFVDGNFSCFFGYPDAIIQVWFIWYINGNYNIDQGTVSGTWSGGNPPFGYGNFSFNTV